MAGLIGAVIVLPQGVAFATLAGMPPEYGLYAAMVPAVVAALFGSSFHLVSGPTNALSILLFAQLAPLAEPASVEYVQLALTVTFLTGAMQLTLGLAGMGVLVNFISHSVVIGFTAAAGLLIIASQLSNFFGVDIPRGSSFFQILRVFVAEAASGGINWMVTLVAVFTIAIAIVTRRFYPKFPYMIVAVVAGALFGAGVEWLFGRQMGELPKLGAIAGALPPISAPDLSLEGIRRSVPIALGMTILGLTEALSIARAIGVRSGQRIEANQEFIGQGLSNLAGSFFSAYPSSGSFNRSGVNYEAGAATPLSPVIAAGLLIVFVLAVAPLFAHLPIAVMAAILFLVGYGLIDVQHVRQVGHTSRREGAIMLATFLTGLFVDLEFAIIAGVLFSLIVYLRRTSHPLIIDVKPDPAPDSYHFSADSGLPDCPQVKMVRVNGSLYFGAVDHVAKCFADFDPRQRHLIVVASGINFIDVAGAEMLVAEARRRRALGGGLYFYRVKDEVRRLLERGGYLTALGPENLFPVKRRVIATLYPRFDVETCRHCKHRIFAECQEYLPDGERRSDAKTADSS
ncbi:MAG: STAS domain-containing protein [Betaproteobacteria bacterium]|nr:STAS domain-containing protein [Betaproteobacteria bacterium]